MFNIVLNVSNKCVPLHPWLFFPVAVLKPTGDRGFPCKVARSARVKTQVTMLSIVFTLLLVIITSAHVRAFNSINGRALSSRRTGAGALVAEYVPDGKS